MEEENNKYASQTPNLTSFLNSTNTELPFNSRSYMIHSIFAKKYNLTEKKIRSSSFSSQMKSLFIKNLILKPWTKQIISHELEKSSKKPANSKTTSLVKISILPTSEELNKKLTKIQAKTPIKQKAKRHKNTHTRQFSAFSTNFNLNSTHLERNFGLQSRTNTESRVNIVSEHPSPKKSTYNPSQISFSSFDSPTIIYKNKRNLSICKKPVHNTFLKIKENSKEIITPLLKNIPILQGDLSLTKEKKCNIFEYSALKIKEIKENIIKACQNFEKINKNDDAEKLVKMKLSDQNDFIRVSELSLTQHEINLLLVEYGKPNMHKDMDIDLVDSIIKRLKFFLKFNKLTRIKLLKTAHLKCYELDFKLFDEGDEGENMYIIIKGAVNIFKKVKDHRTNKTQEILISSLYDGDNFGELAMIGAGKKKSGNTLEMLENIKCYDDILKQQSDEEEQQKLDQKVSILKKIEELEEAKNNRKILSLEDENFLEFHPIQKKQAFMDEINHEKTGMTKTKRLASVRIAETSYIMSISGENYRNILFHVIKSELDFKIRMLMYLPFFQKYEPYGLIPIANYLNLVQFNLGDIILNENNEIDGLYVICKGRCRIVKILDPKENRDNVSQHYTKYLQEFHYFNKKKEETSSPHKSLFLSKEINKLPTNCEYIDYKNIGIGECFGGRAIIGSRIKHLRYENRNSFINLDHIKPQTAKLSVVADSKIVQILKFQAENISLIPEFLKKNFISGLSDLKEFDDFDIEKDIKERNAWNTYKYTLENDIIAKVVQAKKTYKPF